MNTNIPTPTTTARPDPRFSAAGQEQRVLRVWMVDDKPNLRDLFSKLLDGKSNLSCTRGFGSGDEILSTLAEERPPDVILLDINLGEECGIDLIKPIRKLAPSVKILMFTMFRNVHFAAEAYQAGANGFLLKTYEPGDIVRHIRAACDTPGSKPGLKPAMVSAETMEEDPHRQSPSAPALATSARRRHGMLHGLAKWLHFPHSRAAL